MVVVLFLGAAAFADDSRICRRPGLAAHARGIGIRCALCIEEGLSVDSPGRLNPGHSVAFALGKGPIVKCTLINKGAIQSTGAHICSPPSLNGGGGGRVHQGDRK